MLALGTLTFEDETDDAPAPMLVIDLWGTLEPDT